MPEYKQPADASSPDASPEPESNEPMSNDEITAVVGKMLDDAENFIEEVISPQREKAAEYYNGLLPDVEKEEGRSGVVLTELRDVVSAMMPSLMRINWGPERVVEFLPFNAQDAEQAEQETDYISEIVMKQDNPGFIYDYMWTKDALVKTTGVVKWWWDDSTSTTTHKVYSQTEDQLSLLLAEDGVELLSSTPRTENIAGQPVTLYDAEITRTAPDGRARWMPIPPEEFGFSRGARTIESAEIVYHYSQKTTTELLELGIPQDVIDEHGGKTDRTAGNVEAQQRDPALSMPVDTSGRTEDVQSEGGFGPNDKHDYWETYPFLDGNGDGKAELREVCLLGPGRHVVKNEPADERPFAMKVPDPEPHTVLGLSLYDYLGDLQRISSVVFRGVLDSLTAHLNPRYEAVEDQVSIPDLMNHQIGAPVRVKAPNMVRPLVIDFVGADALPILEYVQSIKENRVGVTKAAAGLNPDALQSSTKAAVAATVTAAQQRIELFARIFAETGFKDLMRGLRRLVIKHQPRARIVKMRGKYVEVDPRTWEADRNVSVNVALGLGFIEDKVQTLGVIAQDQKDWLLKLGPTNPMVTLGQYRATMARILKLQGYPNSNEFYMPLPIDFQPPPAPQEQAPDPAMLVAQAEVQKTQAEIQKMGLDQQIKQQEIASKSQSESAKQDQAIYIAQLTDKRERDKMAMEFELKKMELELKYEVELEVARIKGDIELDKENVKAESAATTAASGAKSEGSGSGGGKTEIHLPKEITIPPIKVPEPKVTVNVPAPIVHVQAPAPEKRGKRRRKSRATQNKDGSIDIESEEIE